MLFQKKKKSMMENILMKNISGPNLPPGIRFHPTDQELIIHYLKKKVSSSSSSSFPPDPVVSIIADVDIYKFNPWELPDKARFGESEWFFFSPRDRKYPNGTRPNRAAGSGYWKATGTDKPILSNSSGGGGSQSQYCLGVKKALVFYQGRSPKGTKTNWMMLEYKLIDDAFRSQKLFRASMRLDDWVLYRVRQKSKTPGQHIKQHYNIASTCNSTSVVIFPSPFTSGCLQGQDHHHQHHITNKNDIVESSIDEFQAYLMAPSEIDEEADHGEANSSDHDNHFDSKAMSSVSSNELETLEYLRKALSVGALDELGPSSCDNYNDDNGSIFQVSSPATSASTSPYFPRFIL